MMLFKYPMNKYLLTFGLLGLIFTSCEDNPQEKDAAIVSDTLFTKTDPAETGFDFTNTVVNQKDFNIFK